MHLIDSNVLLDVLEDDPRWCEWSSNALAAAAERGPLAINPVIYAEVSIGFERIEDMEKVLPAGEFRRLALPWEAAFLAGKSFLQHRRRGSSKRAPLPDFFIGAHAAVTGMPLVTRDSARYRSYYPSVTLIAP